MTKLAWKDAFHTHASQPTAASGSFCTVTPHLVRVRVRARVRARVRVRVRVRVRRVLYLARAVHATHA